MSETPKKLPVQVAIIGHSGRGMGVALAAALAASCSAKSYASNAAEKAWQREQAEPLPVPTNLKGGQKKYIQAQRPRWRRRPHTAPHRSRKRPTRIGRMGRKVTCRCQVRGYSPLTGLTATRCRSGPPGGAYLPVSYLPTAGHRSGAPQSYPSALALSRPIEA